jgi:hypothetical protein
MFVTWLLQIVTLSLSLFFGLIPNITLPSWMTSSAFASGVASAIGGALEPVRPFFPIDTILTVLASLFTVWPLVLGYLVFEWVWAHVPTVAGFGTGDG